MKDFQVHPFDLTYGQISNHRRNYTCPKGGVKNTFPTPKASLEQVFKSLADKVDVHELAWKDVLRQLDQSTFDINQNGEEKVVTRREQPLNLAEKRDMELLANNIEFSDFLKAIQRESKLREILSEHQLYYHSVERLEYQGESRLVMKQALEAMNIARQQGKVAKIPSVTYLIESLMMFDFQGTQMLLVTFENHSVQMFESSNGHFAHEFLFYDNVFDQFSYKEDQNSEEYQKKEQKRKLEEKELERAGLSKAEIGAHRRKILREKGEYKPEIPHYTPVIKPQAQQINRIQDKIKVIENKDKSASGLRNVGKFLGNTLGLVDQHDGQVCQDQKRTYDELIEGDHDLDNEHHQADVKFAHQQHQKSHLQKFEKQMRDNSEKSRRDSNMKLRECCKPSQVKLRRNKTTLNKTMTRKMEDGHKLMKSESSELHNININVQTSGLSANEDLTQQSPKQPLTGFANLMSNTMKAILTKDVGQELRHQSNQFAKGRLTEYSKIEKAQQEKLRNNIDDKMEAKELEKEVFMKSETIDRKPEKKVASKLSRTVTKTMIQEQTIAKQEAQKIKDKLIAQETQLQRIARLRSEKRERAAIDREANKNKRKKMKKVTMFGVLGIDSIIPKESQEANTNVEKKDNNTNTHAFGIDHKCYDSKQVRDNLKSDFEQKIARIEGQEKLDKKYINSLGILKKASAMRKKDDPALDRIQKIMENPQELEKYLKKMQDEKNSLSIFIGELSERQDVFAEWLTDFDKLLKREMGKKQEPEIPKKDNSSKGQQLQDEEEKVEKPLNLVKIREKMQRDRKKRFDHQRLQQMDIFEEEKKAASMQHKKTYPMCMSYYEPYNIAIFALVSKEIQIHQLKQTGVRRTFFHLQSLRVENMIVQMSVEEHKNSGNLILCLGTQNKNSNKKSEVVVFILDPKLEYEALESFRWVWPEEQITSVYYKGGCGLILASFSGFIEIFDAVKINQSVWDNCKTVGGNKKSGSTGGGSISCVCYSDALDIIAYGGVSGKIFVLDQTTKLQNGQIDAHKNEIIMLQFYDKQHQLISVSQNGEVGLWDAQKLTRIQILKNSANMTQKLISTCYFYPPQGRIMMATTSIFNYDLQEDIVQKVKNNQTDAIARDYLRSFLKQLQHAGVVGGASYQAITQQQETIQQGSSKAGSKLTIEQDSVGSLSITGKQKSQMKLAEPKKVQRKRYRGLSEIEYLQTAYNDDSIKGMLSPKQERNGSVMPTKEANLIGVIFDPIDFVVYTIGSQLIIRAWTLKDGTCLRSYLIETRDDQEAEAGMRGYFGVPIQKKHITLVRSDPQLKFLIVALEGGSIQINNLYTGALIYNNCTVEALDIGFEIAQMKFFFSQTKFWIAASCCEGRVAFISRPTVSQGRNFLKFKKCKCSHTRDVLTLDINQENQCVTGSVDNIICFWNSFNGVESKKIVIPDEIANLKKGEFISHVKFPFPNKKDLLLVIINNGNCYMLETQSEKFLEFNYNKNVQKKGLENELDINSDSGSGNCDGGDGTIEDGSQCSIDEMNNAGTSPEMTAEHQTGRSSMKTNSHSVKQNAIYKNQWIFGKVASFPCIDLKDGYLLSISQCGSGMMHTIKYDKEIAQQATSRSTKVRGFALNSIKTTLVASISNLSGKPSAQAAPILFEQGGKFQAPKRRGDDHLNVIIQIDICAHHNLFMTSSSKGQVCIYDLTTCDPIGILNQDIFSVPQNMKIIEELPAQDSKRSRKPSEKHVISPLAQTSIDTIRKSGGWPADILRQSHEKNNSRFGSRVFNSLYKTQQMNSVPAQSNMYLGNDYKKTAPQISQQLKSRRSQRNNQAQKTAPTTNFETVDFYGNNVKSIQYLDSEQVNTVDIDSTSIQVKPTKGTIMSGGSDTTRLATLK